MDFMSIDKLPNKHVPSGNNVKRSASTLDVSLTNHGHHIRSSVSFTHGVSKFPKKSKKRKISPTSSMQIVEEKDTDESSDEIIPKDKHIFFIWTKQVNSLEPFMVYEDMLIYQGKKYSEKEIAQIWKKDCRMWLWKTKQNRVITKVVS